MREDDIVPGQVEEAAAGRRLPPRRRHGGDGPSGSSVADMVAAHHGLGEDNLDLLAYWRVLVKRRWMVLGILGLVLAASAILTLLATPIYRATTVLEIDEQDQRVLQVGGATAQTTYDPLFQVTQYELLQSRALAERVVADLNLDTVLRERGILDGEPSRSPAAAPSEEAVRFVREGTSVEPVRNARLARVHFDSPDPELSARIANALAEGFIASGLERRFGASSYARDYLERQLAEVKSRLEASERELVAYAQRENLIETPEGQSLAGRNLADLNAALATAQEQRIRSQARWSQARAVSGLALPAEMLSGSIVRTLQEQRAQLQGEYQQKSQVYKPDYPEMRQLESRIQDLDRQIERELANIRESVRAEYTAAVSQERLLQEQLDSLRAMALDVDNRSIDYNILKREVDTNRELYDGLLQRYKQVGVAGDVRSDNISIIDRAQVPRHAYQPRLGVNLAIGLLIGMLLGVSAAYLVEYLDDTFKLPSDVENSLKLPVLGIVPKLEKLTPMQALDDPRSAFSESYRSVRTALQFSTDNGAPDSLLITSAVAGEGKSTSAMTLARNMAEMGSRVLLIDADLRNPSLHRTLGLRSEVGLSNVLSGANPFAEAVVKTENPFLDVILSGPLPPNPAELLSGSRLEELLGQAVDNYDQVVIDGPPVMGIADAPILAHAALGTVMVIEASKTRIATTQAAMKRLQGARAQIVGALMTQFNTRAAGYGYGYDNYYTYGASKNSA